MKVLYLVRKLSNKERKVEPYKDNAGRVVAFADIEDTREIAKSMKPTRPPQSWCEVIKIPFDEIQYMNLPGGYVIYEKGGKVMTLDDILFAQYQLGREHEAIAQRGEKRKVGGEIAEAKKQIQKLLEKEYVRGINSASDMFTELEKKITENRPPDIIDLMQSTQKLFGYAPPKIIYTDRNDILYKIEEVGLGVNEKGEFTFGPLTFKWKESK